MIVYVAAVNDKATLDQYLMPWFNSHDAKVALVMDDAGQPKDSIFHKYNQAVDSFADKLSPDDIICFIHEDVKILDPNFTEKIELVFKEKQDIGVLGFVGSSELKDTAAWWYSDNSKMRGHIIQEHGGMASHLIKGPVGYFDDLVTVDGLCFFVKYKMFTEHGFRFDEETYDGFDFYDVDICMQSLEKGFKVATCDCLVQHRSIGDTNGKKSWIEARAKCLNKWTSKGIRFPLYNTQLIKEKNVVEMEV